MSDASGFRIRLRVHIAKGLTTEDTTLIFMMDGKEVTLSSQEKDEALKTARWVVFRAHGFPSQEQALNFGSRLRKAVQLAALSARLGVDVGEDKPTSFVSEAFARSRGLIRADERLVPNVHGLSILPDDDKSRIPLFNFRAVVTADPNQILSALRELDKGPDINFGGAESAVRLLNSALMSTQPLAQMVLAFSAVEELGQNHDWSDNQRRLIDQLAVAIQASKEGTEQERSELVNSIQTGLFRLSLRQGVKRLMLRVGQRHLLKEWDRLYGIRSRIFHGTKRVSDEEISQAAFDSVTLCIEIILGFLSKEGTLVPSVALRHFKLRT